MTPTPSEPTDASGIATDPLVRGFRKQFQQYVVRIRAQWTESNVDKCATASGFIIATATIATGRELCAVATARHVVEDRATTRVNWQLTRQSLNDEPARIVTLTTHGIFDLDTAPCIMRTTIPEYDAAAILFSNECSDGRAFLDADEDPPSVLPPTQLVRPGSAIAWAGYPAFVEEILRRPELCFYRGSVAATVTDSEVPMYFIDGHVAKGVSGGPVWHSDATGDRLIGVVSAYWPQGEMPGLCHFAPLNHLVQHMTEHFDPPR